MVRFAPVATAVLLLLVTLLQVSAFCPVGRRSGSRLAWSSSSSSNGRQLQLALTKLMATRGGVAGGKVQEVRTLAETEEAMEAAGDKLVVLDFTAQWCGPCKLIAPIFESLSDEISEKEAVFLKVDIDENEETARRFEVMQMPTFLFVKNGEVLGRQVGANPDKLREAVFKYL